MAEPVSSDLNFILNDGVINYTLNAEVESSDDNPDNARLLEDGEFRLLEDNEFRLLE